MKVLLDTCAALALAAGTLPSDAAAALRQAPEARVSVVTAWEIAIKAAAGKLHLAVPPAEWFALLLEHHELRQVAIDAETACAAAALPPLHHDPFDRLIVALARATDSVVLTADERIGQYPGVSVRW
jgi:PIN domain nuclease of toxin-antitoxin system